MIEDEINREFTDIDTTSFPASIESQGEAGALDLLRLLRPSGACKTESPTLCTSRGAGP